MQGYPDLISKPNGDLGAGLSRWHWPLLCLLLLLASVSALGEECPQSDSAALAWLERMSRSGANTAYRGIVTVRRGGQVEVVEVEHHIQQDRESDELRPVTNRSASIVQSGHSLSCLHPGQNLLRMESSEGSGPCQLMQAYRVRLIGETEVAGRTAVRLLLEPRDMYRHAHLYELDRETAVVLRASTLGAADSVLEQVEFASIDIDPSPVSASRAAPVYRAAHHAPGEVPDGPSAGIAWRVDWVPPGFLPTDASAGAQARRSFTDGLAAFSIFLEPLSRPMRPGEGVERQGSTLSYTRGMQLAAQPVLVTVVGEVPLNTARMVADSVRLK
jgi:sigma-E factor negative regulatory protein RseB